MKPVAKSLLLSLLLTLTAGEEASAPLASKVHDGNKSKCFQVPSSASEPKQLCVSDLVKATMALAKTESLGNIFSAEELELLTKATKILGNKGKSEAKPDSAPSCSLTSTCPSPGTPSLPQDHPMPTTINHTASTIDKEAQPITSEESPDDRRARLLVETATDYDCMEREFDANDPNFDPHEAARVYHKCRLLVVKNVFSKEQMAIYRHLTEDFVVGLHHGQVFDKNAKIRGPNTRDEGNEKFYKQRNQGKWEILHPDYFLTRGGRDFALNEILQEIVSDPFILGDDATFGGSGALLSEPYTEAGHWHTDDTFLFGEEAHSTVGVAGHDIPSVAVNLATPLVELPVDSGLTEYCVGTSHLAGVRELDPSGKWWQNEYFQDLYGEHEHGFSRCPPNAWRVPAVKPGDVILWDYLIKHRAGANLSNMTRPLLFSTYGRGWYSDDNFTPTGMGKQISDEDWFLMPRFMADVEDPYEGCDNESIDDDESNELIECPPPTTRVIEEDKGFMSDISKFMKPNFDKEKRMKVDEEEAEETVKVTLSNKDVPDAKFVLNVGTKDENIADLPPHAYGMLALKVGAKIDVMSGDKVVQHWIVRNKTRQILISKQSVGLLE